MRRLGLLVIATLLLGASACGGEAPDPDAGTRDAATGRDASASDAASGVDAASDVDAGRDAGSDVDAASDVDASVTERDGGDPFESDSGILLGDAGPSPVDAGSDDAGVTYVSSTIQASITSQLAPHELDQPAVLGIGTRTFYPIELRNPVVTVPAGFRIASIEESRSCPTSSSAGERCLQIWNLSMYAETACRFDGDYTWTFEVGCAPEGDCSRVPPELTHFTFTVRPRSADFCESFSADPPFAPFRPSAGALLPTTGSDPYTVRFFTTLELPYRFAARDVTPPAGITLVDFTEDVAMRACDTSAFPGACRQYWNARFDPGAACKPRGDYTVRWDVSCEDGGTCNPAITTYTATAFVPEVRDLCP